jgi:carbamoyl-phosphate synthase/aspartate carbamoyltransferase
MLIALAKEKGLKVTCDVAVYALFFSRTDFPQAECLPTAEDQAALWEHIQIADILSIGSLPHQLGQALGKKVSPASGVEEALPLLLTAVSQGKLTLEDITTKMHDNPCAIFGLPEQPQTYVEVEVLRTSNFTREDAVWSPLAGKPVAGAVHRVVINGHSVYLDGTTFSMPLGRDISVTGPRAGAKPSRLSFSRQSRPSISGPTGFESKSPLMKPAAPSNLMSLSSAPVRDPSPARALSSLQPHPAFSRRHILSVKQFNREDLHALFNLASEMRTQVERFGGVDTLRGRVLCNLFFEPSTRTSSSFETAMKRCGGEVVSIAAERSSVTKGESLPDTIRTLGCYADAIVIRHPEVGSAKTAAKFSPVPIINAGDGIGEHPTQSLLDVYTIREELGSVNGITVTLSEFTLLSEQ